MSIQYKLNVNQTGREFPHYWELCIGSCHAATVLREDTRKQIKRAHDECGFKYLRFHGLFDDDMSVVLRDVLAGKITYSFFNIDSIFDFLLEIGMKPFVELGFMPEVLASENITSMHYKANVSMPKDMEQWITFIKVFIEHLLKRYGKDEVEQWYFEVWNEPNLSFFFDGTQEDYFSLYAATSSAIKEIDPFLKVGGPATSVNAWIPEFIQYCKQNDLGLDFISTHHYPSDDPFATAGINGPGTKGNRLDESLLEHMTMEQIQEMVAQMYMKPNNNPRNYMQIMTEKAKAEAGDYPLIYTEWNGSKEYDTSYQASFVIQTIAYNEGMVEGYSYWCVSDIFEEMGMQPEPFKNAFGIQTMYGIRKPVYQIFKSLHEAGDKRLEVQGNHRTAEVLALADDQTITIFVYNHDIERRDIKTEMVDLKIEGCVGNLEVAIIDEDHTNPLRVWQEIGSPIYPSNKEIEKMEMASQLTFQQMSLDEAGTLHLKCKEESIHIIKIDKK